MKIVCYTNFYNEKHTGIIQDFAAGIPGAEIRDVRDYTKSDIAVIFGLVKYSYVPTHYKNKILENHSGKNLIVIESGFTNRPDYYAIGFGGIHGDADFNVNNKSLKTKRFKKLGLKLQPWKKTKNVNNVLVCGQVPWDTNVQDIDYSMWCNRKIELISELGYNVKFRAHPRIHDHSVYGISREFFDRKKHLISSLKWADCVVTYNSTSAIDAVIHGIPIMTYGTNAMALPLTSPLMDFNRLKYPDRRDFFKKLSYSQWTRDEMRQGLPWKHLMDL